MNVEIADKYKHLALQTTHMCIDQDVIVIELTPTNACNCQCKYCFESDHSWHNIDINVQERQLYLIEDLCSKFDPAKFKCINIVFWGGEPMLNVGFIKRIVAATCKYSFVNYMMYSNGTLVQQFKTFIADPEIKSNSYRFKVQLSYDGGMHHTMMRGDNSDAIFRTAHMLLDAGFAINFKATLAFNMISCFVDSWKSYEKLYDEFGYCARYCPTLDANNAGLTESTLEEWRTQVIEVAKLEYQFIQKHGYPLISWYDLGYAQKNSCNLNYHAAINTDGSIYICHGAFYSKNAANFKIGHIDTISSLYEVLGDQFNHSIPCNKCLQCGAIFCNVCHIACVDSKNYINDWHTCKCSNDLRCQCFIEFSKVFYALTLAVLDNKVI